MSVALVECLLGVRACVRACALGLIPTMGREERFAVGLRVRKNDWPFLEFSDNFVSTN